MRIFRVLIIIFAFFFCLNTNAQVNNNCTNKLREAKELYGEGLIEDIPKILTGCIEDGFTKTQRIEAYKLIIMAYLFDDNQFDAEKIMDEFLKKFPEYEIMSSDPVEFTYLLESFKTSSVYSLNLYLGTNYANPRILESYSALDQNKTSTNNKYERGFQVGLGVSRNLGRHIYLNLDLFYSSLFYSKTDETENPYKDARTLVSIYSKENMKKIDVPLTFNFTFGKKNTSYYFRLGGMYSYITKSSISLERKHPLQTPISENNIDIKDLRSNYFVAALGGFGIKYKVPRGFIVLDMRYHYGLLNLVKPDNRYSNSQLWSKYYYVDDDFCVDYMSFNLAYYFSIYRSNKNRH